MTWSPQKVLVPVDFSDESIAALSTALDIAGDAGKITVIHVLQDLSPVEPGEVWYTIDEKTRKEKTAENLRVKLAAADYPSMKVVVVIGDAGNHIADYAKANGVDLIVMPSHGRSGISRLLIGSVAERVARFSHCPVLILRN